MKVCARTSRRPKCASAAEPETCRGDEHRRSLEVAARLRFLTVTAGRAQPPSLTQILSSRGASRSAGRHVFAQARPPRPQVKPPPVFILHGARQDFTKPLRRLPQYALMRRRCHLCAESSLPDVDWRGRSDRSACLAFRYGSSRQSGFNKPYISTLWKFPLTRPRSRNNPLSRTKPSFAT